MLVPSMTQCLEWILIYGFSDTRSEGERGVSDQNEQHTQKMDNLQNPGLTTTYSGHIQNATVARISPSGYYCASADVTGKGKQSGISLRTTPSLRIHSFIVVNIWDVVGEEQIVKGEYKVISGRVYVMFLLFTVFNLVLCAPVLIIGLLVLQQ